MAAQEKIIFNYTEMVATAERIRSIEGEYLQAAIEFDKAMNNAIADWKGASKDVFASFIANSVKKHLQQAVPQMVHDIAAQLDMNAKAMSEADDTVSSKLPTTL